MTFIINSPLEQFEVFPLFNLTAPVIGDIVISLTNLGLYAIVTTFLIIGLHVIASNQHSLVPSTWSVALESSYVSIQNLVQSQIGSRSEQYTPVIFALFWFLLIANLNGNVPYGFTVTTSAVVCLGLSLVVFFSVTVLAIYTHRLHVLSFFVPEGTPLPLVPMLVLIEAISYLARAASLGVSLIF